ncbi:hypothetical protein CONLIGDRAFT_638660 [Coniochaeta ligniaria NRRL 30616]|uniref:Uncharacterized protein n=1 Tax=Coniochaeta ligniaria NRRL 30616 TaxID=1408157 RepID=A0A1J7J3C2_9PEZI|nr:hypothetical protein CONLIGDRAFT_638660 [Coniochaeta ligniaria NRRL 30616]
MPFELDAGLPLTALPLVPTSEVHARNLLVYRDNVDTENLRLTEKIVSSTATTSHTHHFNHKFNIQRDIAVPLYTLKQKTQLEWVIEVICDGTPLVFSFANRGDVLELQRFFTGYEVKDSFLGAETLARLKGSKRKFRGKSEHHGMAEIQLWEWPDEIRTQLSPMTTRSSDSRTPTSSLAPSELSMSDAVTVQTDHSTGRQAVVSDLNPPPLLVLFLQESDRYTMLGIDILVTQIETSPTLLMDGWLGVQNSRQGDPIEVHMTATNRDGDGLRAWNLCSMAATNVSSTVARKCERLLFKFKDPLETERFDTALLKCRLRRSERTKERNVELLRLANGFRPGGVESPTSPRSSVLFTPSMSTPSMRQSRTFATFPAPAMTSAVQELQRAQFTSRTPTSFSGPTVSPVLRDPNSAQFTLAIPRNNSTPQIETVIPGYRLELQTERPVREVHGNSMPTQEMPVTSYQQWGG